MPPTFLLFLVAVVLALIAPVLFVAFLAGTRYSVHRNVYQKSVIVGCVCGALAVVLVGLLSIVADVSVRSIELTVWLVSLGAGFSLGSLVTRAVVWRSNKGGKASAA